MAWGTEYKAKWTSINQEGYIELQREDYAGAETELTFLAGSLEIRNVLPDWEQQVWRHSCSFTIINDKADYFDLLPLMTASNGMYRVRVTEDTESDDDVLFEGFLNVEINNQAILSNAPLTLNASGYLSKLERDDITPSTIDSLQFMTLIDILDDCLRESGAEYNILVNCSLYEDNASIGSNTSIFNRVGVFTELFWDNNTERKSGLDIIKMILKPFNCYLYWYKENWYIERYEDMYKTTKNFIKYTTGQSYAYGGSASFNIEYLTNFTVHSSDLPQANTSQLLSVIPGLRRIDVRLNQLKFFNLFQGNLTSFVSTDAAEPDPSWRQWLAYEYLTSEYEVEWGNAGQPYKNIANSIQRWDYEIEEGSGYSNGLSTKFRITVQEDTQLTIKFKFATEIDHIPGSFRYNEDTYTFYFYWWLRADNIDEYVQHNESADTWEYVAGDPESVRSAVTVKGTDIDPDLLSYEGSITIPIGSLDHTPTVTDQDFVFGMGTEQVVCNTHNEPCSEAWYGDFRATISESPDNNLIRGDITTDFLDKKTVSLELFDTGSYSYRNVLLTDANFQTRTDSWGSDDDSFGFDSLQRKLLESKFRLYNVARQKIKMEYNTLYRFRPFNPFTDGKQSDKEFVMCADIFYPEKEIHEVELWEYDNETEINLV